CGVHGNDGWLLASDTSVTTVLPPTTLTHAGNAVCATDAMAVSIAGGVGVVGAASALAVVAPSSAAPTIAAGARRCAFNCTASVDICRFIVRKTPFIGYGSCIDVN